MLDSDSEREAGAPPSKRHSSLLSITHQNSFRSAPYRLPVHVSSGWATPSSSPSHSNCSRESSPLQDYNVHSHMSAHASLCPDKDYHVSDASCPDKDFHASDCGDLEKGSQAYHSHTGSDLEKSSG